MTGATQQEKRNRRREASRLRQSQLRQRQADKGLIYVYVQITARAHKCLCDIKKAQGLPNLTEALILAVRAQDGCAPPFPKVRPTDPPGVVKSPHWVPDDVSLGLDNDAYKHRWHAMTAFIVAYHAEVCGEGGHGVES